MATDATRYRAAVDCHGLSRTHLQIVDWVPVGANVLELGCASGYHGRLLIDRKQCNVTGAEVDLAAADEARRAGLRVLVGSLEDAEFRSSIEARFDVVIAADVLEHVRDPAAVLLHAKQWLRPGGHAIIAVPNIATWSMRKQLLLRGDFDYQETGILDRTHLRFFTWDSLVRMVTDQGWSIVDKMFEVDHVAENSALARLLPGGLRRRVMTGLARRRPNLYAEHLALRLAPAR